MGFCIAPLLLAELVNSSEDENSNCEGYADEEKDDNDNEEDREEIKWCTAERLVYVREWFSQH